MNESSPKYGGFGNAIIDDIIMVLLSVLSVTLLCFEALTAQNATQQRMLDIADFSICLIFLIEFAIRAVQSSNRKEFFKRHWWELIASIPVTSLMFQWVRGLNVLRLVRLIRLLRIIRFAARIKIILEIASYFVRDAYLIYVSLIAGLVVLGASLGFHYMEFGENPNVHSLWDSFWWTCVTITTVGYGDIYPVTTGGRIIAIFLMFGGIATFSAVTAMFAAKLLAQKPGNEQKE